MPSTVGKTAIGASTDTTPANVIALNKVTPSEAGVAQKLTGRFTGTGTQGIRGLVYADSAGEPGALVAVTTETTITVSVNWYDMLFATPWQFAASVQIWIGYWTSASTQNQYDTVSGIGRFKTSITYQPSSTTNLPNPVTTPTTFAENFSEYLTYYTLAEWARVRPSRAPLPQAVARAATRMQEWRRDRNGRLWLPDSELWLPKGALV